MNDYNLLDLSKRNMTLLLENIYKLQLDLSVIKVVKFTSVQIEVFGHK